MNKENEFEIIDDFGDVTPQQPLNNEVPPVENTNPTVEIPSFSFGDFETPEVATQNMEEVVTPVTNEPPTLEFDSFAGAFGNDESVPKKEPFVMPAQEETPDPLSMIHAEEPLPAPGTVDVMPSSPNLNIDVESKEEVKENVVEEPVTINPVLPNGEPVVTTVEEPKQPQLEQTKKGSSGPKLLFIIILLVIIAAVIIFLPQISDLLKK